MSSTWRNWLDSTWMTLTGRPDRRPSSRKPRPTATRWLRPEPLEERVVMATWLTATSANFATAARWSGGRVPGSADAADILVGGPNYTVTIDRNTTVSTMTINSTAATVNHNAGAFTLAGTKRVTLSNGKLNIASAAQFTIPQGGTFVFNGGTLNGTVRVNNGATVDKNSGNALNAGARFLFDGFGTFRAGQLGSGQTLAVDAPINSNSAAIVTIPVNSLQNSGRVEFLNTRNNATEAKLQFNAGSATNNGVLQNFGGGTVFLDGPGAKRLLGRLDNNGLVDFGPRQQRFQVDFGLANFNGTLKMKLLGTSNDVLDVRGNVNLGGTLQVTPSGSIAVGSVATIIRNDGTDANFGTFINAPEGSVLTFGGQQFRISYRGGDGNDVTLTRVNTPSQFPDRSLTNPRGNLAVLSGTISDPDPRAAFSLTIDWGDGSPAQTRVYRNQSGRRINVHHKYAMPGEYTVNVSWADEFGEGRSAVMTVRVGPPA